MPAARPGVVRSSVIGFGIALAAITSIDRVVLALSRGRIAAELHLTDTEMGLVFSAYATAYAICEMPSGHLGDRIGPRPVLMRIALWWSLFMAVTGRAFSFLSLYLSQLFFGAGQAGCYPNIGRMFSIWLDSAERIRAQGFVWLSARWAAAFTPVLVAILFRYLSWRQTFTAIAVPCVVWAALFHRWFRRRGSTPGHLPHATQGAAPWAIFMRSRTLWLLCGQYFALVFPWFFLITWAPTFIDERYRPAPALATVLKILPLFCGGLGAIASGVIAAPLARWTGDAGRARKIVACAGFAGAAAGLGLATLFRSPVFGVLAVSFSSFCNDLVMPVAWGTATDVAGRWSGTVSGAMNMTGNFGGALYGLTAGVILQTTHHDWNAVLYTGAVFYLTGVLIWMALDPLSPIEGADVTSP